MQKSSDARHDLHEVDIGSGEKSPSQKDTEEMIRQVPVRPALPTMPPATQTPSGIADPSTEPGH